MDQEPHTLSGSQSGAAEAAPAPTPTPALAVSSRRVAVVMLAVGCGTQASAGPIDLSTVALLLLASLTVAECIRTRTITRSLVLPAPAVGFLALVLASWWSSARAPAGLIEATQLAVLVGIGLPAALSLNEMERRRLSLALGLVLGLNVSVACLQLASPAIGSRLLAMFYGPPWTAGGNGPSMAEELATGLFPSHCRYALFVALVTPFALEAIGRRLPKRWFWATAILLGVFTVQTVFAVSFLALLGLVAVLTLHLGAVPYRPRHSWVTALVVLLVLSSSGLRLLQPADAPSVWTSAQPFLDHADQDRYPKRLLIETAAALESLPSHPFGGGPGTYRSTIDRIRIERGLPRPQENRVRRDSNSQYAVTAVESGLLCVLCLLLLIGSASGSGLRRSMAAEDTAEGRLDVAFAVACAGLLAAGGLSTIWVKGTGPLAAVLIAQGLRRSGCASPIARQHFARILALQAFVALAIVLVAPALDRGAGPPPADKAFLPGTEALNRTGVSFFVEAEEGTDKGGTFVVRMANHTGGHRVLSLPDGSGPNRGEMLYDLDVPETGTYKLWLRVFWEGGCANSVLCQVADGRTVTVADSIFGRWHWVDVAPNHVIEMHKGRVQFRLKGTEDGVHIDQIAFLSDPDEVPSGILEATAREPLETAGKRDSTGPGLDLDFDEDDGARDKPFDKYGTRSE